MLISFVKVSTQGDFQSLCYFIIVNNVTESNCTEGDVHLVDGSSQYEGRVEVCVNRAWGSVCAYSNWSSLDAKVVCNQVGANLSLGT